jgi:allantoate deiminase
MHRCHELVFDWMQAADMAVRIDAIGNVRGVYAGSNESNRRLLIGSHLDTVPNAGAYDGVLGVVLGIALVERLQGKHLPFTIEVIGFSEEEGVRFGKPFLGSRALVGRIEGALDAEDAAGITVALAIQNFGLDPSKIGNALIADGAFGYLEFHIEQGPVLESIGQPLAVVEAIAGQSRFIFRFVGKANHAGTTPMRLRHDALAGAAEWITAVEAHARATEGMVATVGHIESKPGVGNIIPGEVRVWLEVRHARDDVRNAAVRVLIAKAQEIGQSRGLHVEHETRLQQPAVAMDSNLIAIAERAIARCGVDSYPMTSGAGHDAMIVAERIPSVMIFLRSPGGISHHPDEAVLPGDVELALQAGERFLEALAGMHHA